jgi:hypothetical protein
LYCGAAIDFPLPYCYGGFKEQALQGYASAVLQYYAASERLQMFEGAASFAGTWPLFQKAIHVIQDFVYGSFPIYYKVLFVFKTVLCSSIIYMREYGFFLAFSPQTFEKLSCVTLVICHRQTQQFYYV